MADAGTMMVYLGPPLLALAGLLSRLCWEARHDRRRQDTLRALASRRPEVGMLELHDDGNHLHLRVTSAARVTSPESHE